MSPTPPVPKCRVDDNTTRQAPQRHNDTERPASRRATRGTFVRRLVGSVAFVFESVFIRSYDARRRVVPREAFVPRFVGRVRLRVFPSRGGECARRLGASRARAREGPAAASRDGGFPFDFLRVRRSSDRLTTDSEARRRYIGAFASNANEGVNPEPPKHKRLRPSRRRKNTPKTNSPIDRNLQSSRDPMPAN